jgi:hypothetical protein
MKIIAFITEYAVVDRIIDHLKLGFVADKPPRERFSRLLTFPPGRRYSSAMDRGAEIQR